MNELEAFRHRPLVFVDDLEHPQLRADDLHHLEKVLRLRRGDPITIGDGAGLWRPARFDPEPTPTGRHQQSAPRAPLLTVAFTPVKGVRPEWVVQKLTEVGVDRLIPVVTARSIVRWDPVRASRQHEKMVVAARDACLQSRRLVLPLVSPVMSLSAFLAENPGAVAADPAGSTMHADHTTLVVGPEGGFSLDELAGVDLVALPGNVLRAETAAVVAAALVCGLRAGFVDPARK